MERAATRTREDALDTFLSVQQVADLLQISVNSVTRYSINGKLKFYRISAGGDRRYVLEDVVSFQRDIYGPQGILPF